MPILSFSSPATVGALYNKPVTMDNEKQSSVEMPHAPISYLVVMRHSQVHSQQPHGGGEGEGELKRALPLWTYQGKWGGWCHC